MDLFWREHKLGLQLILSTDRGEDLVGFIRRTPRGHDALARTLGYNPGQSQKEIASLEEAKAFVESFRPWEEFTGLGELPVEPGIRPAV